MFTLPAGATSTLVDRLVAKIDMTTPHPGGCHWWNGAYNIDGRKQGRRYRGRRPVICLGGQDGAIVYVAPLLLALTSDGNLRPTNRQGERLYALHTCGCGEDGWYRCVTLEHLRWGTQAENEEDKRLRAVRQVIADGRPILDKLRALQPASAYL